MLAANVNDILSRYILIHDQIIKFSIRKLIPIPGLFKAIPFCTHENDLDALLHRTNNSQLVHYGELLSKMKTNSHILIVWDCDAEKIARKFSAELTSESNVTAFWFWKRENRIADEGIENAYEDELLKPFANVTKGPEGDVISYTIGKNKKTAFANHVSSKATKEYFEHFDELRSVVKRILDTVSE